MMVTLERLLGGFGGAGGSGGVDCAKATTLGATTAPSTNAQKRERRKGFIVTLENVNVEVFGFKETEASSFALRFSNVMLCEKLHITNIRQSLIQGC